MDYLNEFRKIAESIIDNKIIQESNAKTLNQRKVEFQRNLSTAINEINHILIKHAETYLKKAEKDNYNEINNLKKEMDSMIINFIRKFSHDQQDKNGLF